MSEGPPTRTDADQLRRALAAIRGLKAKVESLEGARSEPLAVVGIGCRFPGGADAPESFWEMLRAGVDAVREIPRERWDVDALYDPDPEAPGKSYVREGAFLPEVHAFDAGFFGISPREAASMDPQQRLLLEVAWEALEDAAVLPSSLEGTRTGVFVGVMNEDWSRLLALRGAPEEADAYVGTGSDISFMAGRLSYVLGLQGPSVVLATACSSSLVALHLASQSLRARECRVALAAGVSLILSPDTNVILSKMRALAPDGRCKTFDAAADGYGRGEGCGVLVLKRLADALADGDRVHVVVRGSAINHDGRSNGLTAPNGAAQEAVLSAALEDARVEAASVGYVEAHGTGTSLGDPIEVAALAEVLGRGRPGERPLALGSVKTNFGHLEAAAGVAGVVKAALVLQHGQVPPHLHLSRPNPLLPLGSAPFTIPTLLTPLPAWEGPRRAGVSSFGLSGINAHVILEEPPEPVPAAPTRPVELLLLSARSETALRTLAGRYASLLRGAGAADFPDVCSTAATGRTPFPHRLAIAAPSAPEAALALEEVAAGRMPPGTRSGVVPAIGAKGEARGAEDLPEPPSPEAGPAPWLAWADDLAGRWVSGAPLPLQALFAQEGRRKVRVPTTVFERQRFAPPWEGERKLPGTLSDSIHPLLGRRVPFALALASDRRFEALLSAASPPFLADHRVHGAVLFPAAGFAEMALFAAREATGSASVAQLELVEALVLPEAGARLVQTVVTEVDGVLRLTVASASAGGETAAGAEWTVHARGTMGAVASPDPSGPFEAPEDEDLESIRARCTTEVRPDALYAGLSARGLGYGPRFRSVRSALRRDGEALVSLEVPPRAAGSFVLHPVLLDGCLQAIGLALGPEAGEEAYLPVELSGLRVVAPIPAAVLAHVRVSLSDGGLTATLRILDETDPTKATVGTVARVRLVRVEAPRSSRPREEWQQWLYALGWHPRPLPAPGLAAEYLPSPSILAADLAPRAAERPWEQTLREVERHLDAEAGRLAARALSNLGWKIRPGQRLSLSSIGDQLGVGEGKRRLLGRLLGMLEEDGVLVSIAPAAPAAATAATASPRERRWEVVRAPDPDDGGDAAAVGRDGAAGKLLERCGRALPQVLMGAPESLEALFPPAEDGAELLYGGTPVSTFLNGLLADAVGRAVAAWPRGRAVRLLEVGGGTGSTTAAVLERLPSGLAEYAFTDISPLFVRAAGERWGGSPLFSAAPLDIEQDPSTQGFRAGTYDVVVAANVLHATRDLRVALRHVRALLAPGGLLVLLEVTRPSRWLDLVFGLTDGWWRFADTDLRPAHPLLPPGAWHDLLAAEGFESPRGLPDDADDADGADGGAYGVGSTVLLARRPGTERAAGEPSAAPTRPWLLAGGADGAAEKLAELLAARGSEARVLAPLPGEATAPFAGRVSSAIEEMAAAGRLRGVVLLGALDASPLRHPFDVQEGLLGTALEAVKALARREESGARLVLVTRGAREAPAAESSGSHGSRVDAAGATLWGFGTAVATEHPRLSLLRVDLDPAAGPSCAPLVDELLFPDGEPSVAYRDRLRLMVRLERLEVAAAGEAPVRADGTYLVTGGLGGLGLVTAGWLSSRGARSLALSGRRAVESLLPEETRRELSRLRSAGVMVRLFAADVGREGEVDRLLAEVRSSMPPLRGVIHAAGVLSDGLLERQEWGSFATVLAPKVRGAWDLSEGTRSDPLDFFVLYSSMAGTLGGAGQSNHAAASAFLDALAHDRRARGLPALSIDWGPWSEVGEAVRHGAEDRLGRVGVGAIDPASGRAVLDALVRAGLPQAGVLPADWHALLAPYGEAEVPKFLEGLSREREETGRPAATVPTNLLAELRDADPSRRRDLLARHLAREAGKILGLDLAGEPDPSLPLQDLGLDSLMALELKSSVEFLLGISFPLARLLRGASAKDLAEEILPALEAQLAGPPEAAVPATSLEPDRAHRFDPFPLTDIQMAYWVGRNEAIELGSVGCHFYAEFDGSFDPGRLSRAWNVLVARHGMLRAVVTPDGLQRVLPEVPPCEIATLDLAGAGRDESERALGRVRGEMASQLFDPERWPLFDLRATLLPGGKVRLHVSLDLLIVDAAGIFQLMDEWAALYAAGEGPGRGEPADAGPGLDFRDYVLAAEAFRLTEVYRRSEAYWRARIETLPRAPELPRVAAPSGPPVFVRRTGCLSLPRWEALREKAERAGLTPSGLLCAAYAEVLGRFSRSPRFTLNLTTFQRYPFHPDVARLIGDFTSTLLLAVEPSAPDFAGRARGLQARLEEALDHGHVGGVRVLREWSRLHGEGPGASMPVIFTSLLGYAKGERRKDQSRTPIGEMAYAVSQTPQVWIDHQLFEDAEGLHFNWDSVDALFPEGLTEAMFGAYVGLLEALAEGDAAWEGDPELVPAEQLSVREEANATAGPVPEGLLHEPFERQAAGRPEATAVVSSRRRLTYGELEGEANALGRRLRELGVGPGRLVAVVMEKGWEQVVGVLAVLKAGGAYLPVDAGLPSERISLLLRNGGVAVALVQPWVAGRVGWPEGIEVVAVTEAVEGAEGAGSLAAVASPEDVAYVIYTSGSTGEPKGVVIDHRGALNTCADVNRTHGIGSRDRVLGISSLSFDLSVWDLFGVLGAGGAVVLPEPEAQRDPSRWVALMEAEGVTVWNSVPALVEMLTAHIGVPGEPEPPGFPRTPSARSGGLPASLRLVLMSGDWIPVRLPEAIRRAGREGIELVSMGGATEASIWSIRHPIGEVGQEWTSIPYGRAMANQSVHVLDGGMRERPEWVAGELYIGGIGLAKGYLGDEERTAAKFVVHPKTGERLYRTGDWGRWLPGGVIEFLGREDQQVKVQGHRIELGEVEAALGRLPGVRAAAVALAGERGDRRLVAFVVPHAGEETAAPGTEAEGASEGSDGSVIAPVGSLRDPMERLEFRLRRPGIRDTGNAESFSLPLPAGHGGRRDLWSERRTHRRFRPSPVPLDALSALLSTLVPIDEASAPFPKYRYPSAGDLYPVQLLVVPRPGRVEGLGEGVHYHHPATHRLVRVEGGSPPGGEIHFESNRSIFDSSAFTLFLVYEREAIEPLYGPLARDFALLEAGAILQLLMTEAPALGLGLCPVGAVREGASRALGLTASQELLHTIVCGAVPTGRAERYPGGDRAASLKAGLRALLPDSMVPATFVLLPELPLTANGKVDRGALPLPLPLPAPARSSEGSGRGSLPGPRSPSPSAGGSVEERVAAIVGSVLGLAFPPRDENLFDLGGNSLHVVRIHRLLSEEFGGDLAVLDVVDVFRHPTISSLSRFLAGAGEEGESARRGEERAARRRALRARRSEEA